MKTNRRIKFGEVDILPDNNLLIVQGKDIAITPRSMAVLMLLIEHQGQTLSKAFIFDKVWQDVVVSDTALSRVIADLRQALGDSARAPKYIKTVSKKGFHTVAPVAFVCDELPQGDEQEKRHVSAAPALKVNQWAVAIVLIILSAIIGALFFNTTSPTKNQTFRPKIISNSFAMLRRPSFSSDGRQLVYTKNVNAQVRHVRVQDLTTKQSYVISDTDIDSGLARFSSSAQVVYYMSQKRQHCVVKRYDLISKKTTDIYTCSYEAEYFGYDISPDGRHIAVATASQTNDLVLLQLIELNSQNVVYELKTPLSTSKALMYPRYSPDGNKLAMVTLDVASQHHDLRVLNIQTQQTNDLATDANVLFQVVWGTDNDSHNAVIEMPHDHIVKAQFVSTGVIAYSIQSNDG